MTGWSGGLLAAARDARRRRLAYAVVAIVLAVLCFVPQPFIARAKLLPQDSSSAGLGQIVNSLGGQLASFANLLTGGRPPNDLYLVIGRSDRVRSDVVDGLGLARPGGPYASVRAAKVALGNLVEVHLLVGGVVEVETRTFDPDEALRLTAAYVRAISRNVGALGRQTTAAKGAIVAQRFKEATARVTQAESVLDAFRSRNRLAGPESQLGTAVTQRAELEARIRAKEIELRVLQNAAGPDNPTLRNALIELAGLRAQLAQTAVPSSGVAGPNVTRLSDLNSEYQNLYRDYRFAQALYDVYARAAEQVAVEALVAESATYIQIVEPAHLDPERHYNITAVGLLVALALVAVFTEIYAPATGLRWADAADADA